MQSAIFESIFSVVPLSSTLLFLSSATGTHNGSLQILGAKDLTLAFAHC
jgi:hypothetical protein